MHNPFLRRPALTLWAAVLITLGISLYLSFSTYYINSWPTDSENPYLPTAAKLFDLRHISDIHRLPLPGILKVNMHGKEALIVGIAVMQKLLNDTSSLYPNVLLLIIVVAVCSLAIFVLTRRLLGTAIGFITFLFFVTCFWPYQYVIFGAHQPLALMNFLLAALCLPLIFKAPPAAAAAGGFLGLMLFSSPTAPIYGPYYLALWAYYEYKNKQGFCFSRLILHGILHLAGLLCVLLIFTLPDPVESLKGLATFINVSKYGNNFAMYHNYLQRFFPLEPHFRGPGWSWIVQYFSLIMPVLFPLYIVLLGYLVKRSAGNRKILLVVFLSLCAPQAVEISRVVQFGRNYFPSLVGILGLVAFALFEIKSRVERSGSTPLKNVFYGCIVLMLGLHIFVNAKIFFAEVLPTRMATTAIYEWCLKNNISELSVYSQHPLDRNIVQPLDNSKRPQKIKLTRIDHIGQVTDGYILVPPITGKTIYVECRHDNFYGDPYLMELTLSGQLPDFVTASFPTVAASRIWNMEEEICAYRDLSLNQVSAADRMKGYAYILDAKKLHDEWFVPKHSMLK